MEMRKRLRNVALIYPLFIYFVYKLVGNEPPDTYGRHVVNGSVKRASWSGWNGFSSETRERESENIHILSTQLPHKRASPSRVAPMQSIEDVFLREQKYMFNCGNINEITILKRLYSGTSKQVYIGQYRNKFVVVKVVSTLSADLSLCFHEFKEHGFDPEESSSNCIGHSNSKLLKEILLLHQLSHQNLAKLLGYCVRGSDLEPLDPKAHGAISVFEYGDALQVEQLTSLPWKQKVRHAKEIASLLTYFQKSPIGSVLIKDFKLGHIVSSDSHMRLIDLDGYQAGPVTCDGVSCDDSYAYKNVKTTWPTVFKYLLVPDNFPENLKLDVIELGGRLENSSVTGDFITSFLQKFNSQ